MSPRRISLMDLEATDNVEDRSSKQSMLHEQWPLDEVDPNKARFPCCIVWTPLPVVSWLAPFIGHVGICREDGVILDFDGSNFVNVDAFAYGGVARYVQLNREQGCYPPNLSAHTCKQGYRHSENGTAMTWDDALRSSMNHFEHKTYNLFTCNCHSYVANCLNRICYGGTMGWNMIDIAILVFLKGKWVNAMAVVRSFFFSGLVLCLGIVMVGWPFVVGLALFSFLIMIWFVFGTYCVKDMLEC